MFSLYENTKYLRGKATWFKRLFLNISVCDKSCLHSLKTLWYTAVSSFSKIQLKLSLVTFKVSSSLVLLLIWVYFFLIHWPEYALQYKN